MKRLLSIVLLIALLLPGLSYAQDTAPIIAHLPTRATNNIFALRPGEAPQLLDEASWTQMFISPDSSKIAYLKLPLFAARRNSAEVGYDPSDLIVLDIATSAVMPLVTHGDPEPDTLIFSDEGPGANVKTHGQWDVPGTTIFGSRLYANVAWSPDSRSIAHLQSVVTNGVYRAPTTRLVRFDVETGDELLIAEFENAISDNQIGFAVFWFDVGIVLYRDPPEGESAVHVYNPRGELLHTWEVSASQVLSNENPVRYEGKDYLLFSLPSLYDVATGESISVEGTLALVSAAAPDDSLLIEACSDNDSLEAVWDVYTPQGEKVLEGADASLLALSPDGQQFAYTTPDGPITIFDGKNTYPYEYDAGRTLESGEPVVWGAMNYTVTEVGAQDCSRIPRG